MRWCASRCVGLLFALTVTAADPPIAWRAREVGVGVRWLSAHADWHGSPQSFEVLVVAPGALGQPGALRALVPGEVPRAETSALGMRAGAVAALNGGFFDVKTGAPDGLLIVDGELLAPANPRRAHALIVRSDGAVAIGPADSVELGATRQARAAGPLLRWHGEDVDSKRREDPRHPRTAVGCRADGTLLFVTAAGRTDQAAGLTLRELADLMRELECVDALNLDGGGSTTLWLGTRGIVNHPCDNKRFDHRGERAVSDAIGIFAPSVVQLDEDDAQRVPGGAWRQIDSPQALDGDRATSACEGARALFLVGVPRAAHYRIELDLGADPDAASVTIDGRDRRLSPIAGTTRVDLGSIEVTDPARAVEVAITVRTAIALDDLRAVEVTSTQGGR